jgi:predicted negative regulator of RcsB-dependent stress response
MAEVKHPRPQEESEVVVARAKDFWTRNNRTIMTAAIAVIVVVGGYLAYKFLIAAPKEKKAAEAIFKAEEYYRMDSLTKALNGDGVNPGFEKVISQYGGTKAGNMARFYAGSIYLKTGDLNKAVKHLKEFDTDAEQIQARAHKLLGDAYADLGKNSDALAQYKKAAHTFEADPGSSAEYLYMAAYFADRVMNSKSEAVDLYKEIKKKYSQSQFATEADKYLAQAGVYNAE